MIYFALIIPIVLGFLALLIFKHRIVWWEMVAPIIICIGVIALMKFFMLDSLTNDTEYLSEYPIEARYYEDWNEYIHQICTETCCCDSEGNNCSTTTYDCSYVDYHSEYWTVVTNTGYSRGISQSYYNYLVKLWGNKKFKDMHRDYHTNDGDMYYSSYTGKFEHIEPRTFKQTYENKAQATHTVFKFRELDSTEVKGLFDYPPITARNRQVNCLGCSSSDNLLLERYNAIVGHKYQVKMFVLIFDNPDIEIAERQLNYWKGGNMNELVVCTNKDNSWVKTFSWCDDKRVEAEVTELFQRDIPFRDKLILMEQEVEKTWTRKDFEKDFAYIRVPLSSNQIMVVYLVVTLITIGFLAFGIFNEFEQGNPFNRYRY